MTSGFNATLITFVNQANVIPADVNANFTAVQQAAIFTGTISTLSSDGGKLTSDGLGNLVVGGGKLGVAAPGDRIDAATTPGTLYLSGVQGVSMQVGGSIGGGVTAAGVTLGSLSNNLAFTFVGGGSIRLSTIFYGTGAGTFNHGLNAIPTFAFPMDSSIDATGMGCNNPTSSTIDILLYAASKSWTCWAVSFV